MLDARETLVTRNDRLVVGYDQAWSLIKSLEAGILRHKPEVLVGILRGGAIPALMLSQRIDVPVVFCACNRGDTRGALLQPEAVLGKRVLVVDDIAATGRTLAIVKATVERAGGTCRTMALFYDPRVQLPPDHGHLAHRFIHFVWEKLEVTPTSRRLFRTQDSRYAPTEVCEYYGFDVQGLLLNTADKAVDVACVAALIRRRGPHAAALISARALSAPDIGRLAQHGLGAFERVAPDMQSSGADPVFPGLADPVAFKVAQIRRMGVSTWYEGDIHQALRISQATPVTDVVYWGETGPIRLCASEAVDA